MLCSRARQPGTGYDGLFASFDGHGKRPVYRNRSLLITGPAKLRFVA